MSAGFVIFYTSERAAKNIENQTRWDLVGGGSVINGATLSSIIKKQMFIWPRSHKSY